MQQHEDNTSTSLFVSNYASRASEPLQWISAIVIALLFYGGMNIYWVTALGIAVVVYSFIWYVESLGRGSAILQIMIVIAAFQWILGPIIAYHWGGETLKYRMYVPEEEYMDFAVPAVIALLIGLRLIPAKVNLNLIIQYIKSGALKDRYIYLLILIGLSADLLVSYIPTSLLFVGYILSQFKYIGLLYFIVSEHNHRWLFTIAIFILSLVTSAEHGLFHGLILWSALIFSYICVAINISRPQKIMVLMLGMIILISLQVVKSDYRQLIALGVPQGETKISVLVDMLLGSTAQVSTGSADTDIGSLNARMNQGWIISAVMKHVKNEEDFLEGETIISALKDTLLPRFISEKRAVRVSDNFEKYTGLTVNRNTSMGISILGEAYVNFAEFGGVIFMLFWGIFIALLMKLIVDLSSAYPTIVLWIPLIFLQMVKAETELVVVINHGVKTTIAIMLFFWVSKKILGWKI